MCIQPIFHLATLFARGEAKTRIRKRDWLKLAGEKIRREQVGSVPTFLCIRANKFAKWKTGLRPEVHPCQRSHHDIPEHDKQPDYLDLLNRVQHHTSCNTSYCL